MTRHKKQRSLYKQAIEYTISGGAYFWSGYLCFLLLDKGLGASFFWAKALSTLLGWTVNFLLQRYWVFHHPGLDKQETEVTKRYMAITLVDFALDYAIVWGLKQAGVTPYIGQFVSSAFFTVWNYLWYRFWVFPSKVARRPRVTPARVVAHRAYGPGAFPERKPRKSNRSRRVK